VRKRGNEVGKAEQVYALVDVVLQLWKDIRGKRGKGYQQVKAIEMPSDMLAV
jgi:hypothetical protein